MHFVHGGDFRAEGPLGLGTPGRVAEARKTEQEDEDPFRHYSPIPISIRSGRVPEGGGTSAALSYSWSHQPSTSAVVSNQYAVFVAGS